MRAVQLQPAEGSYTLRLHVRAWNDYHLEIFEMPSPMSPALTEPRSIGALHGTPLKMIEHRLLRVLAREKIRLEPFEPGRDKTLPVREAPALYLGLMFRALAPMRNLDNIRMVADGIEAMRPEEAAYWLGMSLHRKKPRRVLAALRLLLTAG